MWARSSIGANGLVLNQPLSNAEVGPTFGGGPAGSFRVPVPGDAEPQFQHTYLDDAALGETYAAAISAEGGDAPLSYALLSGNLPTGLALAPDGTLSGTPTIAGFTTFSVEVTDADGDTDTALFSLSVRAIDRFPAIVTAAIGSGEMGTPYAFTFLAANGNAPLIWTLSSGSLPPGLALTAGGMILGTPTSAGIYDFEITLTDEDGDTAMASFIIGIIDPTGASGAFTETDGEVVMEAEHFTDRSDVSTHRWEIITHESASGEATNNAIQVLPVAGSRVDAPGLGPSVAFRVLIQTPGDYFVHVRGTGPTSSSDSVFVSVDGSTTDFRNLSLSSTGWIWKRDSNQFTLAEGLHTVNLWMREPGTIIDKLVVNQSSTLPVGLGPPAQPMPEIPGHVRAVENGTLRDRRDRQCPR